MDDKQPYIRQQEEGENLYSRLQKKTLEEVQRLSGKVWTDFNVHDPGVTLADIANYALTETNYKLGFDLADYLTGKGESFNPKRFGLFPPSEVYTTAPVTTEDYRRLFFSHIPELENVWVECDPSTGGYTVKIVLPTFNKDVKSEILVERIQEVYNEHRNLCEYLDQVIVVKPEELEFHAKFEIEPGKDATLMLVEIYQIILRYLSGGISISTPEEQAISGMPLEEWLEGADDTVRVVIPRQQNTEYELYKKLWQVKGIKSFSVCYLMKNGEPLTDFSGGYSLKIPRKEKELTVSIYCGCSQIQIDMEKFVKCLSELYETKGCVPKEKRNYQWPGLKGSYHDIFTHYPIARDFPTCYNLSPDREPPTSFETYLNLYDQTIRQGLTEVKELDRLLSIEAKDINCPALRDVYAIKSRYLDFLDQLYSVESQPAWMEEFDNYGETKDEILRRRIGFLQRIAYLIKNRAQARNITNPDGEKNVTVAKQWFCCLLGIHWNENRSVGNVLASHNLILMKTNGKGKYPRNFINARLIDERILENSYMEPIIPEKQPEDDNEKFKQYSWLRTELPVFNNNFISSGLFRGGIFLDNYRIVHADENEYMLVFRNLEENIWMNLGRTNKKAELNTLANILRHYLQELNCACETLYIVEPVLSGASSPFTLILVLPSWTARFRSPRFREVCRDLLRSLLPAHLSGTIYWLNIAAMQEFEDCYRLWRQALSRQYMDDVEILQDTMNGILRNVKEKDKKRLDDTN